MLYFYLIAAGALIPILNHFFDILNKGYALWLVPLLYAAFVLMFIILHLVILFGSFIFVNPNSPRGRACKFYRKLVNLSLPLLITVARAKIKVSGMSPDDVPKDRRMLFVCNHQYDLDPVIMMAVFPDSEIGFIGKKEIFEKMPLIGKAMHALYGLPIDRENNREAAKTIIEASRIIKNDKASIGIFPEGYTNRTDNGELLPFRNGAFKIALKANAPIVVCAINNTRALKKNICRRRTKIDFKIAKVIYPEDYEGMNTNELGNTVREIMEKAYNEIK